MVSINRPREDGLGATTSDGQVDEVGISDETNAYEPEIFIVEDDLIAARVMGQIIDDMGHRTHLFNSCEDFLEAYAANGEGCLVLDVGFPGMSGLDLLRTLCRSSCAPVTLVISGASDVAQAVQLMKLGALDYMEKPTPPETFREGVSRMVQEARTRFEQSRTQSMAVDRLASLTRRQQQIMTLVLAGFRNKHIAAELAISQRTVENHRARIMAKLGAKSIPAMTLTAYTARTTG